MRRRVGLAVGAGIAGAVLATLAARRLFPVRVSGPSMEPTLVPGDHLVVDRRGRVEPGAIVVVSLPGGVEAVKRVEAVEPAGWVVVRGDNLGRSTDSRMLGPVPADRVAGVVRAVYRPLARWRFFRPPGMLPAEFEVPPEA